MALCLCAAHGRRQPLAADRPNILFIMTDDHAAHAISAYGSRVNTTPNIDRLAREGMRFDNVLRRPTRSARRAARRSSPASTRTSTACRCSTASTARSTTVARLLQAGGYYTGMIGKWHLGSDPDGLRPLGDPARARAPTSTRCSTRRRARRPTRAGTSPTSSPTSPSTSCENRPAGQAVLPDGAPQGAAPAVGAGRDAPRRSSPNRWIPEPPTLWDAYATRTDALHENQQRVAADLTRRDLKLAAAAGLDRRRRSQRGCRRSPTTVDDRARRQDRDAHRRGARRAGSTSATCRTTWPASSRSTTTSGRLLDYLDATGLAKNTIVIYTSDQGFFLGDHGLFDKRFMYEESLRMPFLVRWPAGIKPGT